MLVRNVDLPRILVAAGAIEHTGARDQVEAQRMRPVARVSVTPLAFRLAAVPRPRQSSSSGRQPRFH